MSYFKAKKFIESILEKQSNVISQISLYNKDTQDLINNLKNNKKIKGKICSKDNYYNEEIILDIKNRSQIDIKLSKVSLPSEVKKCRLRYKIIYIIIIYNNFRHLNIMIIDNQNKTIEKFDTNDELMSVKNSIKLFEAIIKQIGLSHYKFIDQNKFLFSSSRTDCNLCVPLSLLFIYIRIVYELKLDQIIDLLSEFNNKDLFRISNWFINYLK